MKIPNQAKKVFTGAIFDVYQWEQELYDGSTAIFERLDRPDTVRVIPTMGDTVILVTDEQPQRPPLLALPGGRIDDTDESPLTAAQRELLEETGLVSNDWELWFSHDPYNKMNWTMHTYIARNCKKVAEPSPDPGERITIHEYSFEDAMDGMCSPDFRAKDLRSEILQMKIDGTLDDFKQRLFKK